MVRDRGSPEGEACESAKQGKAKFKSINHKEETSRREGVEEVEEVHQKQKQKHVQYVLQESSSESESSEEEIVYVQRKKAPKRAKRAPRVVYVSDSESEDEQPPLTSIYSFV